MVFNGGIPSVVHTYVRNVSNPRSLLFNTTGRSTHHLSYHINANNQERIQNDNLLQSGGHSYCTSVSYSEWPWTLPNC